MTTLLIESPVILTTIKGFGYRGLEQIRRVRGRHGNGDAILYFGTLVKVFFSNSKPYC